MPMDISQYPVLYVDDEQDNLDVFRFNFRKSFPLFLAESGEAALEILQKEEIAVVVTDQRMPKMSGLEFLDKAVAIRPEITSILLTAYRDTEVLIEAIRLGTVYRFITKPWNAEELKSAILQAIEVFHLRQENRKLQERLKEYTGYLDAQAHGQFDFGNIVGESQAMRQVLEKIEKVAPTGSTVLVRGETGTGKELVAHGIHLNSKRSQGPFVRVNCAALALGTLESELFGHEKGAFTGAVSRRLGRFELADGGTLFLDEIGDLPMEIQVKLLRILQEREFERVGGEETLTVDVRVISATHKDLESLVSQGAFRQDLYYRLNVFPIHIPPLRERRSDVKLLIDHFIERYTHSTGKRIRSVEQDFYRALDHYALPGNVRELENLIERAIILSSGGELRATDLEFGPQFTTTGTTPEPNPRLERTTPMSGSLSSRLQEEEKRQIVDAIEQSRGNMAAAARALGINRSTLYYRLRKYELSHIIPNR